MYRPDQNEYPVWAETYISKVDGDVMSTLEEQLNSLPALFLQNVDKSNYAYAEGKWTLKEMLGHIIDTERILTYRLTCFARDEKAPLPGFDEDNYVANANFGSRDMQDMTNEFVLLRKANLYLFRSLSEVELGRKGTASGREISVRALLFVIAGHVNHHARIVVERYL